MKQFLRKKERYKERKKEIIRLLTYVFGYVELELEEIVDILDDRRKPISKEKRETGIYPYYGANGIQDYVKDYIFDGSFILVGEDGSVMNQQGNPIVHWVDGKIWVNNHAHILKESDIDILRLKYLYYYLPTINIKKLVKGNIPKLTQKDLKEIKIIIPCIEVQNEIVRILDNYDEMVNKLEQGLPKEIELRKKQYEYYRNKLLSFKEL